MSWTKLTDELDQEGRYIESDLLTKLAIDFSVIPASHPSRSGVYGTFRANLAEEVRKRLKDQIGQVGEDFGLKQYKENTSMSDIIEENLAFIYFSRAINQYTDMHAPTTPNALSLSAVLSNRANITSKMPGVHLFDDYTDLDIKRFILDKTDMGILNKLAKIGISWYDSHSGNYLIDENKLKTIIDAYNATPDSKKDNFIRDNREKLDLSSGASIIDFGMMSAQRGSIAARELEAFERRVNEALRRPGNRQDDSLLNKINKVIEVMFI